MRYWYDWEFLEDGSTIKPISIGIVAEDGRELYLVNESIQDDPLRRAIVQHSWLMQNVVPHLPLRRNHPRDDGFSRLDGRVVGFHLDPNDNCVVSLRFMRNAVRDFLLFDETGPVELWGYYAAYDHVRLMQLFGPMMSRPARLPMRTNDVAQFADMLGIDEEDLPQQTGTAHNALDDARWTRDMWRHLEHVHAFGAPPEPVGPAAAPMLYQPATCPDGIGCPFHEMRHVCPQPYVSLPLFDDGPITVRRGGTPWPLSDTEKSAWSPPPLRAPVPRNPDTPEESP